MSSRGALGWIAAAGALLVCAGCGFKGPLYLPGRNAAVLTRPAAAAPPGGQTQSPSQRKKDKTSPASQPPGASGAPPSQ